MLKKDKMFCCGAPRYVHWVDESISYNNNNVITTASDHIQSPGIINAWGAFKTMSNI